MNLLVRSKLHLCHCGHRLFRSRLISTNASISSFSPSPSAHIEFLRHRIWRSGDPSVSIVSIIEQWLQEGKHVKISELQQYIKQLRNYRRFTQALELSEWLNDQRGYKLSAGDVAIRLDLISKVHGIQEAEKYFESIADSFRGHQVYGSLLNCYTNAKQLEKAEVLMQEMKDMGFVNIALSYNTMLNLYSQMGKYEKLDVLIADMEKRGIKPEMFTFNIRLNAYVACSDIEGMEKLLRKIEVDPEIKKDFHVYFVAANGYLKAGLFDKSLMMLKRSEQLISGNPRRFAYEVLLTSYTAIGYKAEVFRVWNLYKEMGWVFNSGYLSMISSLVKLDDLDSAEKIWEDWNSREVLFDIRIPNLMISAYCRKGIVEKAEAYMNKIVERGKKPDATSWDHLAFGYLLNGQITKAVESISKVMSTLKPGQKPRVHTLEACLKYLKGQGDKKAANELLKMVNEHCRFSTSTYNILLSCVNDENLTTTALDRKENNDQIYDEPPTTLELSDEGAT